jgi:hypothetical protein
MVDDIPLPSNDPDDPVNQVYGFIVEVLGPRSKGKIPVDRERLIITMTMAMLADPNHKVGKKIGRHLFKTWIERGGRIPYHRLSRKVCEPDQFMFAAQYLHDHGMAYAEIANVFGVHPMTIYRNIKHHREDEAAIEERKKLQLGVAISDDEC